MFLSLRIDCLFLFFVSGWSQSYSRSKYLTYYVVRDIESLKVLFQPSLSPGLETHKRKSGPRKTLSY